MKYVVCVEFETGFFADQGELKFTGVVSVWRILLLVWVLFPKSHGGVKHHLKAFPHLWHVWEYFKSCHDYFSTLFSSESNKTKYQTNWGPGCLSRDDKKGGVFSTYFGIYLRVIY